MISAVLLKVANESTLRDLGNRENISDSEVGLGSAVNVLASVHALGSDVEFSPSLE